MDDTAILRTCDKMLARLLWIEPQVRHPARHQILLNLKVRKEEAVNYIPARHANNNGCTGRNSQFINSLHSFRICEVPAPHWPLKLNFISILRHSPVIVIKCPAFSSQIEVICHKDKGRY